MYPVPLENGHRKQREGSTPVRVHCLNGLQKLQGGGNAVVLAHARQKVGLTVTIFCHDLMKRLETEESVWSDSVSFCTGSDPTHPLKLSVDGQCVQVFVENFEIPVNPVLDFA